MSFKTSIILCTYNEANHIKKTISHNGEKFRPYVGKVKIKNRSDLIPEYYCVQNSTYDIPCSSKYCFRYSNNTFRTATCQQGQKNYKK